MSLVSKETRYNEVFDKNGKLIEFTDPNGNVWWDDFLFGWVCNVPNRVDPQYSFRPHRD